MYKNELELMSHSAEKKIGMFNEGLGKYSVSSLLGGLYVCLGTMLAYTIGGLLSVAGSPWTKIVMGLSFGIALCLISFAGADLFTSNTMTMAVGAFEKKTSYLDLLKICGFSWIGNLVASIVTASFLVNGGLISDYTGAYIVKTVESKIGLTAPEMIIRGILCNILVCAACWMTYKLENEAAKVMMTLWAVFAFMTAGYEHSIANMGLFSIAAMIPQGSGLAINLMASNLIFVTIGNFIGGALILGGAYSYMSKKKSV